MSNSMVVIKKINKVGQVQNNRLPLENTLIWNKITTVYPDISPTSIPRVFMNYARTLAILALVGC